ncbi:sulfite exporter TauE/SafE family protein [bacterium]|nr:MAG: sulfite exporter TauE/SafE family protein [bacterium]
MEFVLLGVIAFLTSLLTFFSGFGLGTILAPVFMLFFPVDVSIALTGVVHLLNNLFKGLLIGKHANKEVFVKFGIPAILAAFIGAFTLIYLPDFQAIGSYSFYGKQYEILPFKLLVALVLFVFALWEIVPGLSQLEFKKDKLILGGVLSGFFGGLTGNQGALRSAFLIKAGLTKEAFIGTTVLVSVCVDLSRLAVYSTRMLDSGLLENWILVVVAAGSAMLGAFFGNKLIKKITLQFLKYSVAVFLILISVLLSLGWL